MHKIASNHWSISDPADLVLRLTTLSKCGFLLPSESVLGTTPKANMTIILVDMLLKVAKVVTDWNAK